MSSPETPTVLATETPTVLATERPKISFWRKLGGGSLTISIIVHAILLTLGLVWVLAVIPKEKEKIVDFKPSGGGGGGSPKLKSNQSQKRIANSVAQRVSAVGATANFTLPDPESSSALTSLGAMGAAGGGGLGGAGTGGGKGLGNGRGFGNGIGDGIGNGPPGTMNPFGMLGRNTNALVGTLYDLKQTDKRKPISMTDGEMLAVIKEFLDRGWKESLLSQKFFQAPQKLHQTKIYIPMMAAEGAPAAFGCEKDVQPSRLIILYKGMVTPPKSGKYRFAGIADDVLVVRFNKKTVFDFGVSSGTTGTYSPSLIKVYNGEDKDREKVKSLRDSPMKIPVTFYNYDSPALGSLAVGPDFEAKAGTSYPIEIFLSEVPGGLFGAVLLIEQVGETYEKNANGSPILPLFRIDFSKPATPPGNQAPPFDPKGPSWKIVEGGSKLGI